MPREVLVQNARSRHAHMRAVLLALTGAVAVLLAGPAAGPAGRVLDLAGDQTAGAAAIGQVPAPAGSAEPARSPAPPSAAPSTQATPAITPSPGPLPSSGRNGSDAGVSPARQGVEDLAPTAPWVTSLEGYVWPLAHPRLTLWFGPTPWGSRLVNGERFHDGVDLATFCGDRVGAAHAGTVLAAGRDYDAFMGWIGDLGPYHALLDRKKMWMGLPIVVIVDDGNGYRSVYAHFGRIVVKTGQAVKAGQLLGYEGRTGRASGCHLHYSLFSPWERTTMAMRPDVVERMKLPAAGIARVDPLVVLPPKPGINAPATPRPSPVASPGAAR